MKTDRPGPKRAQLYHGIGDKPMDDENWKAVLKSDALMRKPIVQPDPVRVKLRLIVNKHMQRWAA